MILTILFAIPVVYADISLDGIGKQSYNLGDSIDISGYVLENNAVEGILKMDLVCGESVPVYFNLINLMADDRYSFSQTIPVRKSMVGECYLSVKLTDSKNNVVSERDSEKISISDKLNVAIKVNKFDFLPGELVSIDGAVDASSGKIVDKASAVLDFNGKRYNGEIDNNGLFNNSFNLADNIKSGEHRVIVYVEDPSGNTGNSEIRIKVASVITKIKINTNKIVFEPGEEIVIIPNVYDQADELVNGNVVLELVDPDGKIESRNINGNSEFKLSFDRFALPGIWIIRIKDGELVNEEKITVNEVRDIDTELNGSTLFITNIGNVDYNDIIKFDLNGEKSYQVNKEVSIKPNQTVIIDLEEEEIPGGQYQIVSPGNMITGNVVLTSKTGQTITETAGYIILSVVFLFIVYTFVKKKKVKEDFRKIQRLEGKKAAEKIRKVKYPQATTRFGYPVPKMNESDVKHWIDKATNAPKEENKGSFGIFD